jgi:hypothetical protein
LPSYFNPEKKKLDRWISIVENKIVNQKSVREAEKILKEDNLVEKVEMAAREWVQKDSRQSDLKYMGWEQDHKYEIGEEKLEFEARKEKIFVSHDTGDKLENRWRLIGLEVAYRNSDLEAAVWLIPSESENTVQDLKKELEDEIFRKYIPIQVPLHIIEYEKIRQENKETETEKQ